MLPHRMNLDILFIYTHMLTNSYIKYWYILFKNWKNHPNMPVLSSGENDERNLRFPYFKKIQNPRNLKHK